MGELEKLKNDPEKLARVWAVHELTLKYLKEKDEEVLKEIKGLVEDGKKSKSEG